MFSAAVLICSHSFILSAHYLKNDGVVEAYSVINLIKYSGEECSEEIPDTHIKYQLDNEILTVADYEKLVGAFDRPTVKGVIRRILEKPYHGCLNASRISSWCAEQRNDGYRPAVENRSSVHSEQLLKLAKERVTEK